MTGEQRMLAACRGEPVDRTPVWFMRQAGRSLAEYRELRSSKDILEMQRDPETATHITLMPVERLGVDAAVIYADIMLPLDILGVPFRIEPSVGPIIDAPVRSRADIDRLRVADAEDGTPYVFEAVRLIRRALDGKTAVIGFAGAPFTVACYVVEGRPSREYERAKALLYGEPVLWHELMHRITEVTIRYLQAQVTAGVQVIQLFDSWVGTLSQAVYEEFVKPYSARIFAALAGTGVPTIHFGTGAAHLLEHLADAGPDVVSVDWRLPLDEAWARLGPGKGIQGNLEPAVTLAGWEVTRRYARDVLRRAGNRPGHVFNLGHGVLPDTDPEVLAELRRFVHAETAAVAGAAR